ncbi:MAG TPA: hypothetical protein VMW56_31745 [Candidatus Margulisiibacteriota bacterium]|nr:hypothetical protein [Candidatus Margulisiibacteriota bacterium]
MKNAMVRYATLAIAATGVLAATTAHAKLTPAQKCASAKETAASKKVTAKINCYAKTKFAAPPSATCLQHAETSFTKAFAKAEKPGACLHNGDAAAIEASVDTLITTLAQALQPPAGATKPAQTCAVAKLKAAGKKAAAKIKCHVQDLPLSSPSLLLFCRANAESAFTAAVTKAEKPGACATVGDASTLERAVDIFVNGVVQALVPPPPTATAIPGATATPVPPPASTMCCDYFPGTVNGECFDSIPSAIAGRCQQTFAGTIEPAGTFCSAGANPGCTSTRQVGARCCSVPASGPPNNFCYEYTSPFPGDADCTDTFHGTVLVGGTCDPVSGACTGSPPPPQTVCCEGQPIPTFGNACLDTLPAGATTYCASFNLTVAAAGTLCDAAAGVCGSAKQASACCVFPDGDGCFDFPSSNGALTQLCYGVSGTLAQGVSCGASSHTCGGP